ncbi:unnamed protein product [Spirodela intermedia]|uniref:ENT domain-containing protein n=1 Tax=Spirodela intermedia TaxID=51605 RepID=A0A7I8IXQ5_SPIIN|nr:unnamed protein product [Spirodela intermedia]CAA6662795.1 unnamed protein product [Spirodela intermedia]
MGEGWKLSPAKFVGGGAARWRSERPAAEFHAVMMRFTSEWENHQHNSTSMNLRVHSIEMEAYGAVLRAFVAQSDVLSWGKEELISELRKELRVSDFEHREILAKVNADESIKAIRASHKDADFPQEPLTGSGYALESAGRVPCKRLKGSGANTSSSPRYLPSPKPASPAVLLPTAHRRHDQRDNGAARVYPQVNPGRELKPSSHEKQRSSLRKGRGSLAAHPLDQGSIYLRESSSDLGPTSLRFMQQRSSSMRENPDPLQVERAKSMLREHERALVRAIARLAQVAGGDESTNLHVSTFYPPKS